MSRKIRFWGALGVLGFLLVGSYWVFAAKPAPNVQLRATFMPQTDLGVPCTFLNDAKGAYVTDGKHNVSVWFTSDAGDLFFKFEHHSARSIYILFPRAYSDCGGWLPDTAGLYPELPDEPIDFFRFTTYNSDAFAPPKINFLTMTPGVPTRVRLWTTFCTTQRHYYFQNYYADTGKISGIVEVTAFDNNMDGKLDRWVMTPILGTGDMANIYKHPETGDDSINCLFGMFPMPFKLILERL